MLLRLQQDPMGEGGLGTLGRRKVLGAQVGRSRPVLAWGDPQDLGL